jgi:membrane fusion protein (multidrug efflux system)
MTTMNGTANGLLVESTAKLLLRRDGDTNHTAVAPTDPTTNGTAPVPSEPRADHRRSRFSFKRALLFGGIAVALVVGALVGPRYYAYVTSHESTDDAFVEGHIVQMSPKVGGNVLHVHVTDNQPVKAGDVLVEIDPRDYQARVAQARAALDAAVARARSAEITVGLTDTTAGAAVEQASSNVTLSRSGVETARASLTVADSRVREARARVVSAQAEATRAGTDVKRYAELFRRELISHQEYDNATATAHRADAALDEARAGEQAALMTLRQAESQVAEAQAKVGESLGRLASARSAPQQVAVSRAQVEVLKGEVERARAELANAELNLSYTKIVAPADGRITRKAVEEGALIQPGQALFAIVPPDFWVIANFKETQLRAMQPGQSAEIRVDAWGGRTFRGHVDSIQTGAGARFSLLPPENATGNYVKVVQRVPVKIVFDDLPDAQHPLGPGMSVVPTVTVR